MTRFLPFLAVLLFSSAALAESTRVVNIESGRAFTVDISKADYDAGLRTIQLIVKSSGNRSGSFYATIAAPAKTKIKSTYAGVAPSRTAAQVSAAGRFPNLLKVTTGGRMSESVTIGGSSSSGGGGGGGSSVDTCGGRITTQTMGYYLDAYERYLGYPVTKKFVCDTQFPGWDNSSGGTGGSGGGTGQSGNSISMKGAFFKDACSKLNYFIKIDVSLEKVDAAAFADGVQIGGTVTISLDEALKASFKPRSDGKYAPNPIIIGEIKRYYVEDHFNLANWKSGKLRSSSDKKFGKTLYWKGGYFGVAPARATGGSVSLAVTDGEEFARTGCLKMVAGKRHNINGYK